MRDEYVLEDGAEIAVVGGGPAGSFFSIFALKMAALVGKDIRVTVFELKDFSRPGPASCNRCGGIVSELLVRTLALEGINIPDGVVQRGINAYRLNTDRGSVRIATPAEEKTIASVCRGGGPGCKSRQGLESFDGFLLQLAKKHGARHEPQRVSAITLEKGMPVLFSKDGLLGKFDLVVGAAGINSKASQLFESLGFGYRQPRTVTAAIAEMPFDREEITAHFGDAIDLFLLPLGGIKFAAIIPKETHVTLCVLGKSISRRTVDDFLACRQVREALPKKPIDVQCLCLPRMNVKAPSRPFTDRIVICGDAGSTRLMKDGIGAAYLMGKAAAKTAILEGVSARHFEKTYMPEYKSLIVDNGFGGLMFGVTELIKRSAVLTGAMVELVRAEQAGRGGANLMSSILWDMFTGSERYKDIFRRGMSPALWKGLCLKVEEYILGRN